MNNEGRVDRSIRVILGVILVSLVFIGPQSAFDWIGLVPLITSIIGFCPLYKIIGLNTCPLDRK